MAKQCAENLGDKRKYSYISVELVKVTYEVLKVHINLYFHVTKYFYKIIRKIQIPDLKFLKMTLRQFEIC